MGFLDSVLGKKESLPALDPQSTAAQVVGQHQEKLEELAKRARARIEAIPTDESLYVYVGKPPKTFGVVWYKDGQEYNFVSFTKERGLSPARVEELSDELRELYRAHESEARYIYSLGSGGDVVVTPVPSLGEKIEQVIAEVAA
jgi:hypothetical protein